MSAQDIAKKATELKELRIMQQELADEITALEDAIKAEMTARNADTIAAGPHTIRWTAYTTNRLDTKSLKAELPEIVARYTVESTARRFSIA